MNKIVIKGRVINKHNMIKIVKRNKENISKKNLENSEYNNLLFNVAADTQV